MFFSKFDHFLKTKIILSITSVSDGEGSLLLSTKVLTGKTTDKDRYTRNSSPLI